VGCGWKMGRREGCAFLKSFLRSFLNELFIEKLIE
jgi:hypothetical protein